MHDRRLRWVGHLRGDPVRLRIPRLESDASVLVAEHGYARPCSPSSSNTSFSTVSGWVSAKVTWLAAGDLPAGVPGARGGQTRLVRSPQPPPPPPDGLFDKALCRGRRKADRNHRMTRVRLAGRDQVEGEGSYADTSNKDRRSHDRRRGVSLFVAGAPRASAGVGCTITGTAGNDALNGTPRPLCDLRPLRNRATL